MIQALLWLPLAAGLLCFAVPRRAVPAVALLGTLRTLALSIALVAGFDSGLVGLQQTGNESWNPALGGRYQLGVDGIGVFPILLTSVMWAGATAFSIFRTAERARIYFFMLGL